MLNRKTQNSAIESLRNDIMQLLLTTQHNSDANVQRVSHILDSLKHLNDPETLFELLSIRDDSVGNRNLGEYIARWMGPFILRNYLHLLDALTPDQLNILFTTTNQEGWGLANTTARFQTPGSVAVLIDYIEDRISEGVHPDILFKKAKDTAAPTFQAILNRKASNENWNYALKCYRELIAKYNHHAVSHSTSVLDKLGIPEEVMRLEDIDKERADLTTENLLLAAFGRNRSNSYFKQHVSHHEILNTLENYLHVQNPDKYPNHILSGEIGNGLKIHVHKLNAGKLLDLLIHLTKKSAHYAERVLRIVNMADDNGYTLLQRFFFVTESKKHNLGRMMSLLTELDKTIPSQHQKILSMLNSRLKSHQQSVAQCIARIAGAETNKRLIELFSASSAADLEEIKSLATYRVLDAFTYGEAVARYQNVDVFFEFLRFLNKVKQLDVKGQINLISALPREAEKFIYKETQNDYFKEDILEKLEKLDANECISMCEDALNPETPIGHIMHLQRGSQPCEPGHGTLRSVQWLLDKKKEIRKSANKIETGQEPNLPPISRAIETKDKAEFDRLIRDGADVNLEDPKNGASPIHYAIEEGWAYGFDQLLKHGCDINSTIKKVAHHASPLVRAISMKRPDFSKKLLAKGANTDNNKALWYACRNGYADIATQLILKGQAVNVKHEGRSALFVAAEKRRYSTVRTLLGFKADANISYKVNTDDYLDSLGSKPDYIQERARAWHAMVGYPDAYELLPADLAAIYDDETLFKELAPATHNYPLNIREGITAQVNLTKLEEAVKKNDKQTILRLLDHNSPLPDTISPERCVYIFRHIFFLRVEDAYKKALTNKQLIKNITKERLGEFLNTAMNANNEALALHLLKLEPTLVTYEDCRTSLELAASLGLELVVKELLNLGTDINEPSWGMNVTPLFMACQEGRTETVKILLAHRANHNIAHETNEQRLAKFASSTSEGVQTRMATFLSRQKDPDHIEMLPLDIAWVMGHHEITQMLFDIENTAQIQNNALLKTKPTPSAPPPSAEPSPAIARKEIASEPVLAPPPPPSYDQVTLEDVQKFLQAIGEQMLLPSKLSSAKSVRDMIDALKRSHLYPIAKSQQTLEMTSDAVSKKLKRIDSLEKIYVMLKEKEEQYKVAESESEETETDTCIKSNEAEEQTVLPTKPITTFASSPSQQVSGISGVTIEQSNSALTDVDEETLAALDNLPPAPTDLPKNVSVAKLGKFGESSTSSARVINDAKKEREKKKAVLV